MRLGKRIEGVLSFIVPMALFMALCALLKIAPFGDRTFLYEDMKEQYIDFYAYFRAVLHGKDSLLYSTNAGIGADMFGTWAYYLASPFLLIFVIVPESVFPIALSYFIGLKISAISFTTWLFLRKLDEENTEQSGHPVAKAAQRGPDHGTQVAIFRGLDINIPAFICSIAFAFSGWCVANMTNSMWLDAVIMLPVLGIGILKAVRGEKHSKLFLAITVMVMVIVNYYIAAMILMFTVILALILLILRTVPFKKILNAAIGAFIGLLLDLWLLIPVAQSILGSNKDHSGIAAKAFELYLPKCEPLGKSLTPLMILPKLFSASYDGIEIMEGLPNIYFGIVLLVPFIMYFLNRKIEFKEKLVAALSLVVLAAFFCSRHLDDIAHFGTEPYGYLYRYSFLFSFACVTFAYRELRNIEGSSVVSAIVSLGIALVLLYLAKWTRIRFLDNKTILVNLIFIAFGFLMTLTSKLLLSREKSCILCLAFMALVLLLDSSYNFTRIYKNSALMARSVSEYQARCKEIEDKLALISEDTSGNYRIESYSRITPNDSLHFGYNSVTAYNSLQKVENRLLLYRMGFNDIGLYAPYEEGNTRTCDALLGVKYVMTGSSQSQEGQQAATSSDNLPEGRSVYADGILQNDYLLPKDFISGETVNEVLNLFDDSDTPFEVQEKLLAAYNAPISKTDTNASADNSGLHDNSASSATFSTAPKIFHEATLAKTQESEDQSSYTVTTTSDGEVYFYMDRVNLQQRSLEIYLNGEFLTPYGNAACQKVIHLGHYNTDDRFELTIKTDGSPIPAEPVIVTEDIEALRETVEY